MAPLELEKISHLIGPTLGPMGYELYLVEQGGSDGGTLRIAIDHPDKPISHQDCVKVSRLVSPLLTQAGLLPSSYSLEISSPGAERDLRSRAEYERFLGRRIKLQYAAHNGVNLLEGQLMQVNDQGIEVLARGRGKSESRVEVRWEEITRAHLVVTL